jgi:adenylate cyclase class IV
MKDEQTIEEGQKIADDLMKKLGISNSDLISSAYIDMILKIQTNGN